MAWIECHDDIWEHHKTLRLCELLKRPDYMIVGHLVSLWHFAMRNASESGNLVAWGDIAIERAARWDGNANEFVKALRHVILLDESTIHAWDDFTLHYKLILERRDRQRNQIRKRVKGFRERRAKLMKRTGNPNCNEPVTQSNAATIPYHTLPNHTLPNPTKPTTPRPPKGGESRFEIFWKAYPKKVGKGAAEKAFGKIESLEAVFEKILSAVAVQSKTEQWAKEGGQFIPHPATWINQRRWEDEVGAEKKSDKYEWAR